ncbi:Fe-S cluster assembly protein SufD [Chryseotalea sanaruensis]|uniref:Fe-S cluster assembly protein SufD n=1 Tax=Chryseotalea sanaruensis TaxID=2482724 RepID=A0A401U998_9BACT|nr:Fe-S cluster assembly protein SufD [Chryseotalea sanaruensis]GCC51455.1 Fe-S cluster assembly protein SufD [Chryseotalea sanaruensis]
MDLAVKNNLLENIAVPSDGTSAIRHQALYSLHSLGLPTSKTEEYKHTAISRLLEKNFQSLAVSTSKGNVVADTFRIQNLDAHVLVFINGEFDQAQSSFSTKELNIQPLAVALAERKEIVEKYFSKLADTKADAFVSLNTATWNNGLLIEIKNNVQVTKPILIHQINDASKSKIITASRNLILVGKSSEVSIIEKYDSIGEANFSTTVNEVFVAENAGLTYTLIQNDGGQRYQFNHTSIQQESNSRVNCFTLSLNGKAIRNNLQLSLDGEGIDSHMYGLYLLTGDTLADNHTVADHRKPNSISNELYKGVMDGNSKGVFNGKIYVRPQAQKTNAFQSNRNILLSDKATVNTKPQLEIWADDVKCSHGCTSGQLDEEALFYMQSRGISKDSARAFLLYAYAGEVIEKISNETLRNYIDNLVSERLHKNF